MSNRLSETITACRICGNGALEQILDLGEQPPANSLRRDLSEPLQTIPLVLCRCEACGTLQITETVEPTYLFRNYNWVTGTSATAHDYSCRFRDELLARCEKRPRFVVEVASNDGTFLKQFSGGTTKVLGIDPAENVAALAERNGVSTVPDFFGLESAKRTVADHGCADVIFARNVIPHVADARDVVGGLAHCLAPDGVGAIEFHRADVILDQLHYHSIYHEHLFYHSLHSISLLLGQHDLWPFDLGFSPISGGSFVVYFAKSGRDVSPTYTKMWDFEAQLGIAQAAPWREFARRCKRHRVELRRQVDGFKRAGKRLIGYGASARSSTLLNFCGIDRHCLDVIADRSPLKHGLYAPGTDILITAPQVALANEPDAVLLLAWNFRDEITSQIRSESKWRGDVILPLPGVPQVVKLT